MNPMHREPTGTVAHCPSTLRQALVDDPRTYPERHAARRVADSHVTSSAGSGTALSVAAASRARADFTGGLRSLARRLPRRVWLDHCAVARLVT